MENAVITYFETSPFLIGKHEWRLQVKDFYLGGRCTSYQWRRVGGEFWEPSTTWPRFDPNDTYDGLPKSLERLYYANEHKILKALGEPVRNEQFETEV